MRSLECPVCLSPSLSISLSLSLLVSNLTAGKTDDNRREQGEEKCPVLTTYSYFLFQQGIYILALISCVLFYFSLSLFFLPHVSWEKKKPKDLPLYLPGSSPAYVFDIVYYDLPCLFLACCSFFFLAGGSLIYLPRMECLGSVMRAKVLIHPRP